ncbi:MAG: hypothetical protein HYW52_02510 [Gemmatimonadetes bacterium]|nr:hypothetical protein [Gemmatimonadota bacterium]
MLVLLNPAAGGGRALARWQGIARDLERRWGRFDIHETRALRHTVGHIADSLRHGERRFVAVGGDGTVHLLINALATTARPAVLAQVTIGAVGLGSSNDFHKPFRNEAAARGVVPSRLEFGAATAHDIGLLLYTDADGVARRRYWANNASIGVTADGNHRFNTPDPVLKWLKRLATGPAIGYAALRALKRVQPRGGQEPALRRLAQVRLASPVGQRPVLRAPARRAAGSATALGAPGACPRVLHGARRQSLVERVAPRG